MSKRRPKLLAEFFGTMVLGLLFVLMTLMSSPSALARVRGSPPVGYAFAAALGLMVFLTAEVSGAHFNPSVTLGVFALSVATKERHFGLRDTLGYITAQLMGFFSGALIARCCVPSKYVLDYLSPMSDIIAESHHWAIWVAELVGTTLLIEVVCYLTVTEGYRLEAGVSMGTALGLSIAFLGPISGAFLNPGIVFGWLYSGYCYALVTDAKSPGFESINMAHPVWESFKGSFLWYIIPQLTAPVLATLISFLLRTRWFTEKKKLVSFSDMMDDMEAGEREALVWSKSSE